MLFYPHDFTFVCPAEIQSFANLEPAFAAEDTLFLAASTGKRL